MENPRSAFYGSPALLQSLGLKPNVFDGIIGMIRFGTGKSAELYLTLGDLLVVRGDKALAYRAYRRALELDHPRKAYLEERLKLLPKFIHLKSGISTKTIAAERKSAEAWVSAYQQFEDGLIRDGKDPDDEANLTPFYAQYGKADAKPALELVDLVPRNPMDQA